MRPVLRTAAAAAVVIFGLAAVHPLRCQEAAPLLLGDESRLAAAVLIAPAAAGMSGVQFDAPRPEPFGGQILAPGSGNGGLKEKPSFKKVALWASLGTGVTAFSLSYLFWYLGERAENIYLDVSSIERANKLRVAAYRDDILSLIFAGVGVVSFCVSFPLVAADPASF